MIKVAIVEDDQDIRQGLKLLLNSTKGFQLVGEFGDGESAVDALKKNLPDVLLLDIELPGMSGIDVIRKIKANASEVDILMLTVHQEDTMVFESLCAGATGYLIKTASPSQILQAIKDIHQGGAPMSAPIARMVVASFKIEPGVVLTEREKEVLSKLCEGLSYKLIADRINVSRDTVHAHIKNIYRKLHVHSKSEAVITALRRKLI
ncbi:response regulator transcription factor [bacterium]|nr:response regulator transcription factor [bacterium]